MQRDIFFYISKAMSNSGASSERKLAEMLGLSHTWVTHIRRGALPTDETMEKLARIAGIDTAVALLDLSAWRTDGPARKAYESILQRITSAALIMLASTAILTAPAQAAVSIDKSDFVYYGNSRIRFRRLLRLFQRSTGYRQITAYAIG